MAEVATASDLPAEDDDNASAEEEEEGLPPSLCIPIQSSSSSDENLFVEIFPEELPNTSASLLKELLRDEQAESGLWADAALMYMQQKQARESLAILQEAVEHHNASSSSGSSSNNSERVRLLAATGIAHLAAAAASSGKKKDSSGGGAAGSSAQDHHSNDNDTAQADQRFMQAGKIDTFFPMTWMGRGMLNIHNQKLEQAKFFFQTTLKQCGPVLPALLGMAAVLFGAGDYAGAQEQYATAMRRHPVASGAATRVGFGLACYQLGQVDRAKAAFQRALALDAECVPAMVGSALLDMAGDAGSADAQHSIQTERAIKKLSIANLLDHSNAMVQNHLANHYFWKWTPVAGTVSVRPGSTLVKASQPIPLDPGEPVRIGTRFEAVVVEDAALEDDDDQHYFRISKPYKDESSPSSSSNRQQQGAAVDGLKVWKKDYERVFALAKGAYNSTRVQSIQAESLFLLARVYHAREDTDNAHKFYQKACQLAPDLTPARFGLAQTLVIKGELGQARKQLQELLSGTAAQQATDALALLGLLQVKSGGSQLDEGLVNLRKAIDLDPLNPELVVLEAMALQQHKSHYPKSLEKYKKAVDLMKRASSDPDAAATAVPFHILNNIGVLSQETKKFDQALDYYKQALLAADESGQARRPAESSESVPGGQVKHADNDMFFDYVEPDSAPIHVQRVDAENKTTVKVVSPDDLSDESSLGVKQGEGIRIGDSFVTTVVSVQKADDGKIVLELADAYDPMVEEPPADAEEEEKQGDKLAPPAPLLVKRENQILTLPEATTIAFNIARLHEATGRTEAAIELHKALIKRNPAYVNSYLRLACIAVDSGALTQCAEWLKIGAKASPGNSEVLTLIGNLHLSLCDWKPAQDVFEGLMGKKIANVEAYSALSMGTIYFETMHISPQRYAKHLQYASDYYKKILGKDPLNAYAANGLGTVLAEKGEIFKAKEIFNRVREVSEDSIADALLNLGHIFLAQKKHPEALQMYQSYLKRAEDVSTPTTSKSRADDLVDVLLYIAFAYFDWARHTELFNDSNAAPADGRYQKALEFLESALQKGTKRQVILKYNLCMTKLQAANCVLQKLTRNIPRTVEEVANALKGLEESLVVVEGILKDKEEGEKVPIKTTTLEDFLKHCRANVVSAQSHLEDEKKRAEEEAAEREIRRLAAEAAMNEERIKKLLEKEEEQKKQEERDRKAEEKMRKVEELRAGWEQESAAQQAEKERKNKKPVDDEIVGEMEVDEPEAGHGLFDESDDEAPAPSGDGDAASAPKEKPKPKNQDLFGSSDEDDDDDDKPGDSGAAAAAKPATASKEGDKKAAEADDSGDDEFADAGESEAKAKTSSKDLFGDTDSEDESDEELVPKDAKRPAEDSDDDQPKKKRRVLEDED